MTWRELFVRHFKKVHFPVKAQMKLEGKTMVGWCRLTPG